MAGLFDDFRRYANAAPLSVRYAAKSVVAATIALMLVAVLFYAADRLNAAAAGQPAGPFASGAWRWTLLCFGCMAGLALSCETAIRAATIAKRYARGEALPDNLMILEASTLPRIVRDLLSCDEETRPAVAAAVAALIRARVATIALGVGVAVVGFVIWGGFLFFGILLPRLGIASAQAWYLSFGVLTGLALIVNWVLLVPYVQWSQELEQTARTAYAAAVAGIITHEG